MKATWKEHYSVVPQRLASLKKLAGVASVFNANIDAVLKLEPEKMVELMTEAGLSGDDIRAAKSGNIAGPAQLFKGLLDCFERGAAQEWLVDDAGI